MSHHAPTILITGASTGIGEAIARRFAQAGNCRLILTGRRQAQLEQVASSLSVPTHILCFDVRDAHALDAALQTLPSEFADVDMLINNAGAAFGMERAHEYNRDDWDAMVDINVKGLLYCTHALLPQMVRRNHGHVVNIGSIAATYPYVGGNVYGATKAFVHQFSQNLRADLLGTNVRISIIAPGLVETEFFDVRFKGDKEKVAKHFGGVKALTPEDIAETVYWCTAQPPHVNVTLIEVMPTCQAPASISMHRN